MLATILAISSLLTPQTPPPTTGILADQAFVVLPEGGSDLKYWEVDDYLNLQTVDPRYVLGDIMQLPGDLQIGSFSRGTGWMHMGHVASATNVDYVYPSVAGGWAFMTFTVSGTSYQAGTAYNDEMMASGSVTGDVFAYIVPGSIGFPDDEQDLVHKVREGAEVPGGPIEYADIDGFLGGMSMTADYTTDFDGTASAARVTFYFSVYSPSGNYGLIPDDWVRFDTSLESAATVFKVTYSGGEWGNVSTWKSYQELGLATGDQITALSVMDASLHYQTGGVGPDVILSAASANPTEDEDKLLWVVGRWPLSSGLLAQYRGRLATINNTPFAVTKLGIIPTQNRIRGACVDDPFVPNGATNPDDSHDRWRRERMAFLADATVGSPDLIYSLHRQRVPHNQNVMRFRASLDGYVSNGDLYAQLQRRNSSNGWDTVAFVMRNGGGKRSVVFEIPITRQQPESETFRWSVHNFTAAMTGESEHFSILVR